MTSMHLTGMPAGEDPVDEIRAARDAIHKFTGEKPTLLVMSYETFGALWEHKEIQNRVEYAWGRKGMPRLNSILAGMLGFDAILVV